MRGERANSFSYHLPSSHFSSSNGSALTTTSERHPLLAPNSNSNNFYIDSSNCRYHRNNSQLQLQYPQSNYSTMNGYGPRKPAPPTVPHRNPFAVQQQQPRRPPIEADEEDSINCSPCCDDPNVSRTLKALVLGQVLSLCLCGTGVSSQLLADRGVKAPAAQSFTNYFLLCFVYCVSLACKTDEDGLLDVLRKRGWRYLVLAIIDVEANYMIVKAYQYTNLTSIQLLDCATIPTVLFLSWLFLSVRYLATHIIGVTICLVGIACVIWADALGDKNSLDDDSNKVLGDFLCLAAAVLYAICNVAEEFLVKQYSRTEYLGMLGLFGCIVSGIQLAIFEPQNLESVIWDGPTIAYFALFAFSMFIFYSFVTVVLQKTSALMFNLSTLTADFYSLLFGIFLFKDTFHYLYFVSFVICIIGMIIYSLRDTQTRDADEPRRVCPCLFFCCCCCSCCFEDGESVEGSIDVSPTPNERMQMGLNPRYSLSPCPVHHHQNQNSNPDNNLTRL
ncbi:unnamed protein product [Caenorhabditis angaria]|uniref:Uncharacterized protein n=1 Tax=Caenorhabditis angaria TaxID=860376 RepID=A0A9P1I8N0_9PELO|nr:unnamed protein product [Caenorhabditis angaria]